MAITKTHAILGLGAAAVVWLLTSAANVKNSIAGLNFSFVPKGFRLIGISEIEVTLKVRVQNVGFADLPLQSLNLAVERVNANGTSYQFATTDPAGVPTPIIRQRSITEFDLPLRTGTLQGITELWTAIQKRGMNQFRVVGTIQAAGLSLPLAPVPFRM